VSPRINLGNAQDEGTKDTASAHTTGGSAILGKLLGGQQNAGKKEKVPAYVSVDLLDRLRNTVVGLQRDPEVDAPPVSLSSFVEAAIEVAVRQAEDEYNGGRPYPQRPHRHLKTGPPVN
jgi:hypothetical protein